MLISDFSSPTLARRKFRKKYCCNLEYTDFLDMTSKAQLIILQIDKLDLIEIKLVVIQKTLLKDRKDKPQVGRK